MKKNTMLKPMKTRRRSEFARLRNASRTKALPVLPVPGVRGRDHHELVAMSERLAEEASRAIATRKVAKGEMPALSAVVGVE